MADMWLPVWVQCTNEGCGHWRKLPAHIELHHVKLDVVKCSDCSLPEDPVSSGQEYHFFKTSFMDMQNPVLIIAHHIIIFVDSCHGNGPTMDTLSELHSIITIL